MILLRVGARLRKREDQQDPLLAMQPSIKVLRYRGGLIVTDKLGRGLYQSQGRGRRHCHCRVRLDIHLTSPHFTFTFVRL